MAKGHDEKIDSKGNDATGEASGPQVDTSSTQTPQTSVALTQSGEHSNQKIKFDKMDQENTYNTGIDNTDTASVGNRSYNNEVSYTGECVKKHCTRCHYCHIC